MTSNVCHFPAEIIALERVRECKRMIAKCRHEIETADPHSSDVGERVRAGCAPDFLAFWQDELRRAERQYALATAGDAMQFGGRVYRAERSAAGAN